MQQKIPIAPDQKHLRLRYFLPLLAGFLLLVIIYINMRFSWQYVVGDATSMNRLSQNVLSEGTILPGSGSYPFGFLFASLNAFVASLTGLSIQTLQLFIQPFLTLTLVPASFVAFRSLTEGRGVALLATILLFLNAEFLFEATRSSHGKFTWLLALTMLFILARSFQDSARGRPIFSWIILFYLCAFALITSNSFFASSYIFAIFIAFLGTRLLYYWPPAKDQISPQMRRLSLVILSTLLLFFIFLFYLYPPALQQFDLLGRVSEKLMALFLDVEVVQENNPYNYIQSSWRSGWAYLALTSLNWIVLLLSFLVWLLKAWRLLVRGRGMAAGALFAWLLYAGFALFLLLSVVTDFSGALSRNMQLRVFPHLMVVSIPLASEGIAAFVRAARRRGPLLARPVMVAFVIVMAFLSIASLLKVTNEPFLNNRWTFYHAAEENSIRWAGDHLQASSIWIGPDTRLRSLIDYLDIKDVNSERSLSPEFSRYLISSDIMRMHAARSGYTLPNTRPLQKVYDAGSAEFFHVRPQTPFQR